MNKSMKLLYVSAVVLAATSLSCLGSASKQTMKVLRKKVIAFEQGGQSLEKRDREQIKQAGGFLKQAVGLVDGYKHAKVLHRRKKEEKGYAGEYFRALRLLKKQERKEKIAKATAWQNELTENYNKKLRKDKRKRKVEKVKKAFASILCTCSVSVEVEK